MNQWHDLKRRYYWEQELPCVRMDFCCLSCDWSVAEAWIWDSSPLHQLFDMMKLHHSSQKCWSATEKTNEIQFPTFLIQGLNILDQAFFCSAFCFGTFAFFLIAVSAVFVASSSVRRPETSWPQQTNKKTRKEQAEGSVSYILNTKNSAVHYQFKQHAVRFTAFDLTRMVNIFCF